MLKINERKIIRILQEKTNKSRLFFIFMNSLIRKTDIEKIKLRKKATKQQVSDSHKDDRSKAGNTGKNEKSGSTGKDEVAVQAPPLPVKNAEGLAKAPSIPPQIKVSLLPGVALVAEEEVAIAPADWVVVEKRKGISELRKKFDDAELAAQKRDEATTAHDYKGLGFTQDKLGQLSLQCKNFLTSNPLVTQFHNYVSIENQEHVKISKEIVETMVSQILNFASSVFNNGKYPENFGRYIHKSPHDLSPNFRLKRSMLLYTKKKFRLVFNLILKAEANINKGEGRNSLYFSGSTKTVKIFGLLYRIKFSSIQGRNLEISEKTVIPIVTFTRISSIPMNSNLTTKAKHLKQLLEDEERSRDFVCWNDFILFEDPIKYDPNAPSKKATRLLGYQEKAGVLPCGQKGDPLNDWTPADKIIGIITFLNSLYGIVSNNYLPIDIKFDNMIINFDPITGQKLINVIDYLGAGPSYSLFKDPNKVQRQGNDVSFTFHPKARTSEGKYFPFIGNMNLYDYMEYINSLNKRSLHVIKGSKDENAFKILIIQLLFEIAYNIYFIWNRAASSHYDFGGWANPWYDKQAVEVILPFPDFKGFLLNRMYDFNIENLEDIFPAAMRSLKIEVDKVKKQLNTRLLLSPELNAVLEESWIDQFNKKLLNIPNTKSPFSPIVITQLIMI